MYDDPPQCITCGQPKTKVYCTSVPDSSVQLLLKQRGLGKYAGPVHRIDVGTAHIADRIEFVKRNMSRGVVHIRDTDHSLEEELLEYFMEPVDLNSKSCGCIIFGGLDNAGPIG